MAPPEQSLSSLGGSNESAAEYRAQALEYAAQERAAQERAAQECRDSRFQRMEKKTVECGAGGRPLLNFKRYAKVYRESDMCCDDQRCDSDDRFSSWKPSQDCGGGAGWCLDKDDSYGDQNNAQVDTPTVL